MITIKNLSREWPEFSLKNINLEVKEHEYFVILGPTGAGKTLLLELIAGFHKPDRGQIKLGKKEVTHLEPEKRDVGFVYQDYSLFPHLTVEENIKFGPTMKNYKSEKIREKTREIMEMLNIEHLEGRYPETLSGGEQQRAALARGLIVDPKVLLLDEPISALDVPSQEKIRRELRDIHKESGITTLHVTHNREEASWLGDKIGVMSEGEIVQVGTPAEIFQSPKSEFVANFVGVENIFKGKSEVGNGIAEIDIGEGIRIQAVSEMRGNVKACIRPDEIIVSNKPVKSSGRNMLRGKITRITEREDTVRVRIDTGKEFAVTITRKSLNELGLEVGKKVYIAFKASAVHVF